MQGVTFTGTGFPFAVGVSGAPCPPPHILTTHPFLPQCVEELEDPIACYLRNLCRSSLICRPILLDFSLDRKPSKVLQPGEQTLLAFVIMGVGRKLEAVSPLGKGSCLLCPQNKTFGGFPRNFHGCKKYRDSNYNTKKYNN